MILVHMSKILRKCVVCRKKAVNKTNVPHLLWPGTMAELEAEAGDGGRSWRWRQMLALMPPSPQGDHKDGLLEKDGYSLGLSSACSSYRR